MEAGVNPPLSNFNDDVYPPDQPSMEKDFNISNSNIAFDPKTIIIVEPKCRNDVHIKKFFNDPLEIRRNLNKAPFDKVVIGN